MPVYLAWLKLFFLLFCDRVGAVAGNKFPTDQVKMPGNLNCCPEDLLYGLRIVSAEVGL